MKIVKLASLHVPFDTRIFQKEAKSLTKAGHEVTIIVPHTKDEIVNDIQIESVKIPKNGKERLTKTVCSIFLKAFKHNRNSIIHFHDSELILAALLLKILGRKVIYDAHEDTPRQTMYQHWIPFFLRKPVAWTYYVLEKIGGWTFDRIIIAEPIIGRYFPKDKTTLIRNFALVGEFQVKSAIPYNKRENIICYVGGITEPRGASTMIKSVDLVSDTYKTKFYLGGSFHPKSLHLHLKSLLGWKKVFYQGWVSREKVASILSNSRIGIIIPEPNSRYTTNYPVKLFEYMSAGIPVIASKEGVSKKFVEESDCGILVDPLNTDEIAKAIEYLFSNAKIAEDMGKRGKLLIRTKYNWGTEEAKLIDIYKSLSKR